MKSLLVTITLILSMLSAVLVSAIDIAGGHMGPITALIHTGDRIISAGEDGFIGIWNVEDASQAAQRRFQLTNYSIRAMVKHPLKDEICIIESGDMDQYRISVWNYRYMEKIFTLRSREPVTFVNYSAGGSFIITGGFGGRNLTLLDSNLGRIISFPNTLTGTPAFAITGRAERNILVYQSRDERSGYGGLISYLDLNSTGVTNHFEAPAVLSAPIIFGNNRFLAGTNSDGLLVVDAASGAVLDRAGGIKPGALLCSAGGEFYCINREDNGSILYRFAVDNRGNLTIRQRLVLSVRDESPISTITANGSVVFGTEEGNLYLLGQQGRVVQMAHNNRPHIAEIAAAGNNIAFLTEDGELCFIPLNYRLLERTQRLTLENKSGYTMITPLGAAPDTSGEDQFLLWQTANTQLVPVLINEKYQTTGNIPGPFPTRFPLRSVSSGNNSILFLDSAGNLSIYDQNDLGKMAVFTFSSVGATDAAFINSDTFILCRSVISGNTPFLVVNINTGETLPLSYQARAGTMVYSGNSGNIFAAAVNQDTAGIKTTIIGLSPTTAAGTRMIIEYPGEDARLSIAESSGFLAVASSSEGAAIYAPENIAFERTEGLPVKLLGTRSFFISLDSEGNIAWHDNRNGKLLAVFRLYADKWTLFSNREITGALFRP